MLSRCHPHNDARCGKTEAVFPAAFPRVPRGAFRKQDISSVKQHSQSLFTELWSQQRETVQKLSDLFFSPSGGMTPSIRHVVGDDSWALMR